MLATLVWARAAGVDLGTVAYAVVGFRADASRVLAEGDSGARVARLGMLALIALAAGIVTVLGGFVVHVRGEWRDDRATTTATAVLLVVEVAGLLAGGSFWRDYLFPLVPVIALCVALLARRRSRRGSRMRAVVVLSAASTAISLVVWAAARRLGCARRPRGPHRRGGRAGGPVRRHAHGLRRPRRRPAQQRLRSPYRFLWSLPMRTLDPDYAELTALLAGPRAPTWVVEWVSFTAWQPEAGASLRTAAVEPASVEGAGRAGVAPAPRCGCARPGRAPPRALREPGVPRGDGDRRPTVRGVGVRVIASLTALPGQQGQGAGTVGEGRAHAPEQGGRHGPQPGPATLPRRFTEVTSRRSVATRGGST